MQTPVTDLHVFWQPGCTSCLRTKEFLTKRGVHFVSRNVLEDATAMDALAAVGLRQVPIVMRGRDFVDGQVLSDVARVAGIPFVEKPMLPVAELASRLDAILAATGRFVQQVPTADLATLLPNRPRSYGDLTFHIANIPDAFLEHDVGIPLEFDAYNRVPPKGWGHVHLTAYLAAVRQRMTTWFETRGPAVDWAQAATVYYGRQTLHQFLERTTWHAGQHTRQLQWVLETKLDLTPDGRIDDAMWADLPMPESIWDPA